MISSHYAPTDLGRPLAEQRSIRELEAVKPLRAHEASRRWRASYDLILAQLRWYQLRLFEYGIGMDQIVRNELKARLLKYPKHNRWTIRETSRKLALPDSQNQKRFGVSPEELQQRYSAALEELAWVQKQHPGTPWASRAKWESRRPFGVTFGSYYRPPPKKGVKSRPRPKPPKPPKL